MGWAKLSLKPGVKRPFVVTFCRLPMHQCDRWRRGSMACIQGVGFRRGGVCVCDVTGIEKDS